MKVIKWLDEYLEEVLMGLLLIGIVALVSCQVIARYVFNNSLTWSDELAKYFLVWSCFLSVSYCVKKRISIKIDQFQNMLSEKALPWIKLIRHTVVFIFCILMLPFCVTYVQQAIDNGATSSALQIPMYYIQSAPLAGFALLTIRVGQAWLREFRASKRTIFETIKEELRYELLDEMRRQESEGKEAGEEEKKIEMKDEKREKGEEVKEQ